MHGLSLCFRVVFIKSRLVTGNYFFQTVRYQCIEGCKRKCPFDSPSVLGMLMNLTYTFFANVDQFGNSSDSQALIFSNYFTDFLIACIRSLNHRRTGRMHHQLLHFRFLNTRTLGCETRTVHHKPLAINCKFRWTFY